MNLQHKKTHKKTIFFFILVVFMLLFHKHVGTIYAYVINKEWDSNTASYGYDADFPLGDWRDRASSAASAWSNVTEASWGFFWSTGADGYLYKDDIDGPGGTLATASTNPRCGAYVCTFSIVVDEDEAWYAGTGTPSSTQTDLQSTLAHEFGHVAALGHTDADCTNSSRPTMCSSIPKGTTYMRTLQIDDRYGLAGQYP